MYERFSLLFWSLVLTIWVFYAKSCDEKLKLRVEEKEAFSSKCEKLCEKNTNYFYGED